MVIENNNQIVDAENQIANSANGIESIRKFKHLLYRRLLQQSTPNFVFCFRASRYYCCRQLS